MMDNLYLWNADNALRSMRRAEVLSVYFPCLGKVLVVDLRHDAQDGPMVAIEGPVSSSEERAASIQRLRPRFPLPADLTMVP
jgi:hypothetical protein